MLGSVSVVEGKKYIAVKPVETGECTGCVVMDNKDTQLCNIIGHCYDPDIIWKEVKETDVISSHRHYFKDVSHLDKIDVYRVLDLYEVTDPCIQHAVKKLLVAGGRGVKDISKDIQEAIDSLERWKEMQNEGKSDDS